IQIHITEISFILEASFCEFLESDHSLQDDDKKFASLLGITKEPLYMD
ncbi:35986_t:CDS:1, partial [Gigaspora margarita]